MDSPFRCLLCRHPASEVVYAACPDYYLGKPYRADYVRCTGCGLIQQFPIPTDVAAFYDAYPVHQPKSWLYRFMRRSILAPVYMDTRDLPAGTALLDYGCGDGWFLEEHRKNGFRLLGYERDAAHARQLARDLELPVYSDWAALLQAHRGQLDVVTMHFVMEHLPDLHAAFEQVRDALKPGGRFFFVVPDITSFEARLFGRKWHHLDAPRHLSFPVAETVRQLARQHGFEWQQTRGLPFPNGLAGSLPVVLTGRFRFPLFLLLLPLGVLFSRVARGGTRGYWLTKSGQQDSPAPLQAG
jgi:SAM-dependent methyltransferase